MKKNQLNLFDEFKFSLTPKEERKGALKFHGFAIDNKKNTPKRKSRADGIYLPEERKPLIYGLRFEDKRQRIPEWALPKISTSKEDVLRIINENDEIGLDFEYNPTTHYLSIAGVASATECAACRYDREIGKALIDKNRDTKTRFIGHFVLGADKPVLEEAMGIETPLWLWEDSMIAHYLCKAELAKAPGKEADGDGALGFMGLGFAAHFWTNLVMWKECRGLYCEGPCPSHSVFQYCAVDSWAGLEVYNRCMDFMSTKGIPRRVYDEHKELALNFCLAAEKRGIHVDLKFAKELESEMERKKLELFPEKGGRFNPRSNIQVTKYFGKHGIILKANDKTTIENKLEEVLFESYGISSIGELTQEVKLSEEHQALYDLYLFKSLGKGVDAWVAPKYIKDGKVHPRFVFTGASTMRLSSSSPNIQNIPARSWGKDVKKIFIPPPGKMFLSSDASQLELRIVLYEAGVDPKEIKGDAFTWLVSKAPEAFEAASKIANTTPRQMAKTVSHASSYAAGIKLFDPYEVNTSVVRNLIKSGALEIHEDWIYCGKVIGFTGIRLAEILFRLNKKTPKAEALEMRRKALQIQKYYFDNFPIRSWHRRIFKEAEKGFIQTKWGSYLTLIESPVENAKIAAAKIGQGEGAEYVQGKQLEVLREICNDDVTMDAQVHDEILLSVPKDYSDRKIKEFTDLLYGESHRFPGFVCEWKTKKGLNWGDCEPI